MLICTVNRQLHSNPHFQTLAWSKQMWRDRGRDRIWACLPSECLQTLKSRLLTTDLKSDLWDEGNQQGLQRTGILLHQERLVYVWTRSAWIHNISFGAIRPPSSLWDEEARKSTRRWESTPVESRHWWWWGGKTESPVKSGLRRMHLKIEMTGWIGYGRSYTCAGTLAPCHSSVKQREILIGRG